jgi:signal transduction histidine kinase
MIEPLMIAKMDTYYFGSMIFSAVSSVVLAAFLQVKDSPRLTLAWRLSMFCTCVWSLGRVFMSVAGTYDAALGWMRFAYSGSVWLPVFWLWVSHELTGRTLSRFRTGVILVLNLICAVSVYSFSFIPTVTPKLNFPFYDDKPGPFFFFWSALFTAMLVWALVIVFLGIRRSAGQQRNRLIAFFIFGLLGFWGSATTFPLVFDIPLYPFGVSAVAISTVLMSYAVVRHNVMDTNLAFRYGTIWILYVFTGLGLSIGPFVVFGWRPNAAWVISCVLAVGGSPFLFERLLPGITSWVDRFPLFKGRYVTRHEARTILASVQNAETVSHLLLEVVEKTIKLVHAKTCHILFWDDESSWFHVKASRGLDSAQSAFLSAPADGPLADFFRVNPIPCVRDFLMERLGKDKSGPIVQEMDFLQSEVSVPLFYRGQLQGMINLSVKDNGRPYNDIDLNLLSELAQRCEHRLETLLSGLTQQQMTSLWAHDLMRPFGPKGCMHQLEKALQGSFGPLSPELSKTIELINEDAKFVHAHLKQIISAKSSHGFRMARSSLDGAYLRIQEKYNLEAVQRTIKWIVECPPTDLKCVCDCSIIEHRVISNLVENAFRHTPPGGTVTLGHKLSETAFVGWVSDTGPGIREEDQKRLFQSGVQLNENEKGLAGLGLASC